MQDHHRVGPLALGGTGAQPLLLLRRHALAAVRPDDQVVRAVAGLRPLDDLGEVDLALQLRVGPEVRRDRDREHHDHQGQRAELDPAAPVRGRAALDVTPVTAAATATAAPAVRSAAARAVDLARVVAAVVPGVGVVGVAVLVAVVVPLALRRHLRPLRRRLRPLRRGRAALDVRHRPRALGPGAVAAPPVALAAVAGPSIGPIVHSLSVPRRPTAFTGCMGIWATAVANLMHSAGRGPRIRWTV